MSRTCGVHFCSPCSLQLDWTQPRINLVAGRNCNSSCMAAQPNLADKVERCMDEKFLPFSKHKGSQITNWFQQVCEKEALAFEN
jgi:hypothetical protein